MKNLFFIFMFSLLLFSCDNNETITDQSTLEKGGLAVFADKVIQTSDLSSGKFVADISDANGNLISYEIVSVAATIDGVSYPAEAASFKFGVPSKVEISFTQLTALFGLTPADLDYGDVFSFVAKVTTNDGRVFGGATPSATSIPASAGINPINNTTTDVLNGNFKQAMRFSITIACPSYDVSSMYGTYLINDNAWDEYSSRTPAGYTVQCVAGPSPNTLKFINFSNVGTDLIVTVNPSAQSVTSSRVKIYSSFYTFGDSFAEGRSGLVFSCIGVINLKMQYSVGAGTFSNLWDFTLTKQ